MALRGRAGGDHAARRNAADDVPARRPAVVLAGRRRVARRGRVDRTTRATARCPARGRSTRPLEPDVHRAGLHRPRVRRVPRRSASACGRRGSCPMLAGVLAVLLLGLGVARIGGRDGGAHRRGTARDELRLGHVRLARGPHGGDDGRVRRRVVRSPTAARSAAAWGVVAAACAMLAYFTKASAVFFVAALGLVWRLPSTLVGGVASERRRAAASWAARARAAWLHARRARGVRASIALGHLRRCRTGRSTGSTTGRCRSRASRPTPSRRSSIACRGSRWSTTSSRGCGLTALVASSSGLSLVCRWTSAAPARTRCWSCGW